ncbi:Short-chain alcohol dehydrogenase [Pyrenophora tritici-repentis]|uniref:Uncharacterized protein n=1 Tax=Pyrenophora tritici-repentis TaxID=45151 RepID=A0A834RZ29_9PLEO|nr:hypothetical protein PtrM4_107540 [Pyrenophora tritici-repentis]KAI0586623.1 Short-chain alcohol dehydrogenase [Pyrenophora tritici-repentis]KAI1545339.1 Short-chain alcohol dehydrogenase [Pyrenophora tritici-repentis]KAI1556559.1 Short-chain alcohol dehydrogenase [Pyrenophora tritici-repentis]KAI1594655.1 Short-chain alcohol dehydrogenase [Pyrenophora tritici-repentis]
MPPSGLAILIGAGPATVSPQPLNLTTHKPSDIACVGNRYRACSLLAYPGQLCRRPPVPPPREPPSRHLQSSLRFPKRRARGLSSQYFQIFSRKSFADIKAHDSFKGLKLKLAIYSIKHSSKKSFLEETRVDFEKSLETYVGGAFTFAQESLKRFFEDHGEQGLVDGAGKKGTLIFTGTLGALRCSAQFAAYGASRASVRQLAQTLAREMSEKGVYVAHTIANGAIVDQDGEDQKLGKKMSADAVGETYLWLHQQKPCLWTHELDMRPACEKF